MQQRLKKPPLLAALIARMNALPVNLAVALF
jgi:hypothetical protein